MMGVGDCVSDDGKHFCSHARESLLVSSQDLIILQYSLRSMQIHDIISLRHSLIFSLAGVRFV